MRWTSRIWQNLPTLLTLKKNQFKPISFYPTSTFSSTKKNEYRYFCVKRNRRKNCSERFLVFTYLNKDSTLFSYTWAIRLPPTIPSSFIPILIFLHHHLQKCYGDRMNKKKMKIKKLTQLVLLIIPLSFYYHRFIFVDYSHREKMKRAQKERMKMKWGCGRDVSEWMREKWIDMKREWVTEHVGGNKKRNLYGK